MLSVDKVAVDVEVQDVLPPVLLRSLGHDVVKWHVKVLNVSVPSVLSLVSKLDVKL